MILTEQNSGCTININIGGIFFIQLKENPTTGYRWMVETINGVKQIEDQFILLENAVGGGGVRKLQFCALNIGTYELHIKKWQEWNGEGSVIQRFQIKIIVEKNI
ncbi:protease inhibitor I42 family protein [Lysinibacillus xylanilyticus]|uniref:protease inhibitor I42 family protein n=1 Tax=Lysinibacillus xylanilyticus TaxID=582475 RepID=UPI002B2431C9|nr:protease inhibitor I42 family protein [Lysinibacillus xylanilyticus]MEB2282584.1 protease inhibitor I42 family protein [Lysinibacillus xylanilyticus]